MKKQKSQPTFLVRQGNRIKEYTTARIAKKLQSGDLSPDHLAHNRDGLWRPLHETPGFRRLCRFAITVSPPLDRTEFHGLPPAPVSMAYTEQEITGESNPVSSLESITLDILNDESLQNSQEPADSGGASNSDPIQERSGLSSTPIPYPSAGGGSEEARPLKASLNPYGNRQYFRVRKADPSELNPRPTTGLTEIFLSPQAKMVAAGLVGLVGLYFSGQFFFGDKKSEKPLVSGPQLSLLVNPDQEKNLLAQGHGRGVTERDKKFLESFRKSYMENMKQP